jgi:CheY-like chemotaxis protein
MKPTPELQANVLLIDDNRNGLLVRSALLQDMGCHVEMADNGEEGLRIFRSSRFDVVITDYRMPHMNGVELIGRIREIEPQARIILLSKVAEPLGLTEANTGADAVVPKSCSEVSMLPRTVRRLLSRPVRRPVRSQPAMTARVTAGIG